MLVLAAMEEVVAVPVLVAMVVRQHQVKVILVEGQIHAIIMVAAAAVLQVLVLLAVLVLVEMAAMGHPHQLLVLQFFTHAELAAVLFKALALAAPVAMEEIVMQMVAKGLAVMELVVLEQLIPAQVVAVVTTQMALITVVQVL